MHESCLARQALLTDAALKHVNTLPHTAVPGTLPVGLTQPVEGFESLCAYLGPEQGNRLGGPKQSVLDCIAGVRRDTSRPHHRDAETSGTLM